MFGRHKLLLKVVEGVHVESCVYLSCGLSLAHKFKLPMSKVTCWASLDCVRVFYLFEQRLAKLDPKRRNEVSMS